MLTSTAALGALTVDGNEREVGRVRAYISGILGPDHPRAGVACLLVSELVTNAVQHSRSHLPGGTVTVTVTGTGPGIRVEVTDDGGTASVPAVSRDRSPLAAHGRGLLLVEALADGWGYQRGPAGTTVWVTLVG